MKATLLVLLFSQFNFFSQDRGSLIPKSEISIENCNPKILYYASGVKREEGCLVKGKKESVWKFYNEEGWLRFQWNYVHDEKNGEYKSFYRSGKINSIGYFINGSLVDTTKFFNEQGQIFKISVWKEIGKSKSELLYEKSYLDTTKSSGSIEVIDGKRSVWIDGKSVRID